MFVTVNNSEYCLTAKSLDCILCYVNIEIVTDRIMITINYDYGVIHGITESLFSCLHLGLLHNSLSHWQTVKTFNFPRCLSSLSTIKDLIFKKPQ